MSTSTTLTLQQLMIAIRQRVDMFPSGYTASTSGNTQLFVTDSELITYINQSYFELYDLLVAAFGNNYYTAAAHQFTSDGSSMFYALPTDFYKMLGLDLMLGNTQQSWITIHRFEFIDRNRFAVPNFQSFYGVTNIRYRIHGNNLWLTPIPAGGQNFQLWYIPEMTLLASLSDTLDGVSGWTEYVIVDAAIKCAQKEESDVSVLLAQKAGLITRIEAMADTRDAGAPPKVSDAMYNDFWFPSGSGSGDGSGSF